MKKIIIFLSILLVLLPFLSCTSEKMGGNNENKPEEDELSGTSQSVPEEQFHIYLCFGQSNMVGYLGPPIGSGGSSTNTGWVTANGYDTPPDNFKVMAAANDTRNPYNRKKGEWYLAVPPLNRAGNGLSPSDFFGRTIANAVKEKGITVGVIVVAVDGCTIDLFYKNKEAFKTYIRTQQDWMRRQAAAYVDPGVGNEIPKADFDTEDYPYKRLVDMAKIAQKTGIIKGIIMLHEDGARNKAGNEAVREIYNDLCEDLGLLQGEIPLLAGQSVGNRNGYISSIPNAFANLPNTAFVISSDGCAGWNPDSTDSNERIHFSLAGYEKMGKRYGKKMLELVYGITKP